MPQARFSRSIELRKFREDTTLRAEKWASVVPSAEEAREAFKRIDTDGNGTLDHKELTTILTVGDEHRKRAYARSEACTLHAD